MLKMRKRSKTKEAFKKVKEKSVNYWIEKKAWPVFSKWIRERDKYICITCGKIGSGSFMNAGHYISRKHKATIFDERNVHAQCINCNRWGYGNIGVYTLKLQQLYGEGIIRELAQKSIGIKQWTIPELEEIIKKYDLTLLKKDDKIKDEF